MISRITGLVAAPFTAFDASGDLNLAAIERQAEHLETNGVSGAFVCGTTGEGASMTLDERMGVAKRWREVAGSDLKIIVHVGHNCRSDAIALAAHAVQIGAAGVGAVAPSYYKPATVEALVEFLAPIAQAAPNIPFYYYHIPSVTGVAIRPSQVLACAADLIPNLAGVKFTDEDIADYPVCLALDAGRFDCLFGRDEMLIEGLGFGAKGAIGSTYNFAAPLYIALIEAYRRGDGKTAQTLQDEASAMITAIYGGFGGFVAGKALMATIGIDCGPVRSPLTPLTDGQINHMRAALEPLSARRFIARSSA